jgi:hypothetical protein
MACEIKNSKGIVVGKTIEGIPSKLFRELSTSLFFGSDSVIAKIEAKSLEDNKFEKYPETGEPKVFYRNSKGEVFEDLEELLITPNLSDTLSIGFKKGEEFVKADSIRLDSSEVTKFIVSQVREGFLSAKKVLGEDGVKRFQGKGEFEATREVSARLALMNFVSELGVGNVKVVNKDQLEVPPMVDMYLGEKDGRLTPMQESEVLKKAEGMDNMVDLLVQFHEKNNTVQKLAQTNKKVNTIPEAQLVARLNGFLESLGFTKTSLESYRKNYNTKYGQDPDIQALADIANKVVAFKNGQITVDQLSEEVAHIAIEAYSDQESIALALANVNSTPEYNEFSEFYRQKYAPFYEGVALEDQVRKEILGKILAKEFVNKFQTPTTNENTRFVLDKVREIWERFINWISGRIKPYHSQVLRDLNKDIVESIINNDMSKFERDLSNNTNFFYDAMDTASKKIEFQLKTAKKVIEDLAKGLEERVPRAGELEKIEDDMLEIDTLRSINAIVGIASNKMGVLESSIAQAESTGDVIDKKGEAIYNTLTGNLRPILNQLKSGLESLLKEGGVKSKDNQAFAKRQIEEIKNISARLDDAEPKIDNEKAKKVEQMIEATLDETNLNAEQREAFKKKVEGNMRDLGFFGKLFGLASQSQNPIINLLHRKVVELQDKVNVILRARLTDTVNTIFKKGLQKYQKSIIKYDENGKQTYYRLSPWNWAAIDKAKEDHKMNLAASLSGKTVEEVKKLSKTKTFKEIIGNEANFKLFREGQKKWGEENTQKQYTKEYYDDKKKKFESVGVSELTSETLSNLNSRSFEILRPYMNESGIIDKSKLTEADKKALADIRRDKEIIKSPYNAFGEVREGLRVVKKEDLSASEIELYFPKSVYPKGISDMKGDIVVLEKGVTKESLDEEARVSYDMNNLTVHYLQQLADGTASRKPIKAFEEQIIELEKSGGPAAFDWVTANATLTLSDEYYDAVGTTVGFTQRAEEYIKILPETTDEEIAYVQDMQDSLQRYTDLTRKRKNLIKQNRRLSNPIETNAYDMPSTLRKAILELDDEINEVRKELNIPQEEEAEEVSLSERTLNEDYTKMLTEFGKNREVEFAMNHMSKENVDKVEKFIKEITALVNGKRKVVQNRFEKFIQEMVDEGKVNVEYSGSEISNKEEVINTLTTEYARRNVGSYFQRFAPIGYDVAINKLRSGEVKMSDFFNDRAGVISKHPDLTNITINPDYSWLDDVSNEKYINKNYKKGGYYFKPDVKWLDNEFFERYGIRKEDFLALPDEDLSKLKPTKNQEEYETLTILIKLKEDTLALYGDTDKTNKYLRVQRSAKAFEKLLSVGGAKAKAQDFWSDFTSNRVDEKEYGEQLAGIDLSQKGSGVDVRVIPKYYQEKLENPEMLSVNEVENALQDYRQAVQYQERSAIEKDVKSLEWKLSQQNLISNGGSILKKIITKKGATSNYMNQAKEYIDHHLYGIQQTRSYKTVVWGKEIDLTRMVAQVQKFASFSNLGFNLFVDITGATTGVLNNVIDRFSGEYYHKSSANRAVGQVSKYLPGYVAEIGKTEKNTKMSAILEYFGNVEPTYRVENSGFNRGMRVLKRSPYLFSKLSNMSVTPRILFAILNDYRFHNGRFVSFNDFEVQRKTEGATNKQISKEWSAIEKDSFYDNLDITAEDIKPNTKFLSKFDTPESAMEVFEKTRLIIVGKSKQAIQSADGVLSEEDKVAAQRDVLTNLFMMHRGWLLIGLSKKFKKGHFNLASGQYEEGHYLTAYKAIENVAKSLVGKGSVKEYWGKLEPNQRRNLKRVAAEAAVLAALIALGNMLSEADDEDDTWIENLSHLIALRTLSETSSSQAFGLPGTITEIAKSPITITSTIEAMNPIAWIREFDEYDREENNKLVKRIVKATPFKRIGQYSDLQKTIDNFIFYNSPTLLGVGHKKDEATDTGIESAILK